MTKKRKTQPVFYDCEASGLGGHIIEIGWAYLDDKEQITSESHMILPSPEWNIEDSWNPDAELLHGISYEQLLKEGKETHVVASLMNSALANRELFSDSPFDEVWIHQLFDAANITPAFTTRRMLANILIDNAAGTISVKQYKKLKAEALRLVPRTHCADQDARHLATLWLLVQQSTNEPH